MSIIVGKILPDGLRIRTKVVMDRTLSATSKLIFIHLLDLSLHPEFNSGCKGKIVVTDQKVAEWLGLSRETVAAARRVLEKLGYVWTDKLSRGSIRITRYNIAALVPKREKETAP